MFSKFNKLAGFAALSAALLVAACSDHGAMAPEMPTLEPVEAITNLEYKVVKTDNGYQATCTFTSDEYGGEALCGPHKLVVPAGAVSGLVDFEIVLDEYTVGATFSATSQGSTTKNDVGAAGFAKALTFAFDYTYVEDKVEDESKLGMAHIDGETILEVIDSQIDTANNIVSGRIEHFSTYGLIAP